MMKELEAWRKDNGNVTYTVKELLQGLHVKFDKQDAKCLSRNKDTKYMVVWMFGLLFSLIGALASYVFLR